MNTEDDAAYFKRAESLLKQVLQQQATDLDAISGATFSSDGILEAIADALEQAKQANSGNQTTTVTTAPAETTTATVVTTHHLYTSTGNISALRLVIRMMTKTFCLMI